MSNVPKETPYIYQPYGIQNKDHWAAGRIYAIASGSPLTTISGLTKQEANLILAALKGQRIATGEVK